MLIRLARVRPGAERGRSEPEPDAEDDPPLDLPATRPEPVPGAPGRHALPQRSDVTRVVDRKPSLDRLLNTEKRRLPGSVIAFAIMVLLPTLLAGLYYSFVASPQYASEFRFSVRSEDGGAAAMRGASTANAVAVLADNFVVADFAESRDVVDRLEQEVGLRRAFGAEHIDWLSRFNRSASVEKLVAYWAGKVDAHFDLTTGINTIAVRAFSPDDAHRIASAVQRMCEELINSISDRARQTQMRYAEDQVARAEEKLKAVRARELEFRTRVKSVDASKTADAQIALASKIEGDLATIRTEYDMVSKYLDQNSPRLKVLKEQIESTEAQLAAVNSRVKGETSSGGAAVADAATISEYENIKTDGELALKLYESALDSYEQARLRAVTDQLFLATFVQPSRPEDAAYPRRVMDTFLFFLGAMAVWVVATLVYYSIRDHAH